MGPGWRRPDAYPPGIDPYPAQDFDATVVLGICDGCRQPVVTVRMADHKPWTVQHGPAWSSPWAPLIRDGDPDPDRRQVADAAAEAATDREAAAPGELCTCGRQAVVVYLGGA